MPALTLRAKRCTTSIPRNPSVPGDVHGRIRATTTVINALQQANLRREAGVQDGCFYRFTVRGYVYACGHVLTVGSKAGVLYVALSYAIQVRKEQVSWLRKLGSESQQCHHQPGSERTKDQPPSLRLLRSYLVDFAHVLGGDAVMCTHSSQECNTVPGSRLAVTFNYCWWSCEDVLIGQNHETIDPLWTSFDGMACSLSQCRLRLSS